MRRFDRLRKTCRQVAQQMGHKLGVFYYDEEKDVCYSACTLCKREVYIFHRDDVDPNKGIVNRSPKDITPLLAIKLGKAIQDQLQITLYPKRSKGCFFGIALIEMCEDNDVVLIDTVQGTRMHVSTNHPLANPKTKLVPP